MTRRLFVGVPLPDEAVQAVSELVDGVRARGLPAGMRDVRWVRLEGLHLTLRFLGPTPERRIGPTLDAVETVARRAGGPIDIELAGAGGFPSGRRPRTLWIGITKGQEALSMLATATNDALTVAGWEPEIRPFRPHLTIARSDGLEAGVLVADRIATAIGQRRIPVTIDRIGLFESVTGRGAAVYVPLALRHLA